MRKKEVLERLRGGLIGSCQAEPEKGSCLAEPRDIARLAQEVLGAGACAVRICGTENIQATRTMNPDAIVIGITKGEYPDGRVLITPGPKDIYNMVASGTHIIGLDMTERTRPNGQSSVGFFREAKRAYPDTLFMADIATAEEAAVAIKAGVDLVGTTLSGYTEGTESKPIVCAEFEYRPDTYLLCELIADYPDFPIIAEGRWRTSRQCSRAINRLGAWAVCAGSQITRPYMTTKWHVAAIKSRL